MSTDVETGWPYDAIQDDPLTTLRIPVVRSAWPWWKYEMCVVITEPGTEESRWELSALRPNPREIAQLAAELEYKMAWYNDGWKAQMRKRPLDIDSGTNTVILQKVAEGDWRYRKMTFQHGLWPFYNMEQRFTLEQLLDHINDWGDSPNPRWREFKAAHPEAFGQAEATA